MWSREENHDVLVAGARTHGELASQIHERGGCGERVVENVHSDGVDVSGEGVFIFVGKGDIVVVMLMLDASVWVVGMLALLVQMACHRCEGVVDVAACL